MTPDEFVTALAQLGWKQTDLARMTDMDKNTPTRWARGYTAIPGWVPCFLDMALNIRRLAALIEPPRAARQPHQTASKNTEGSMR